MSVPLCACVAEAGSSGELGGILTARGCLNERSSGARHSPAVPMVPIGMLLKPR